MSESDPILRIHPAIGFARLGNSSDYLISAETMAGMPVAEDTTLEGGLPIRPGSESDTVTSRDFRDRNGALKGLAARFRVFHYTDDAASVYPSGGGEEIKIGSVIDGRQVKDIVWTVHLANKKSNAYDFDAKLGLAVYEEGNASKLKVRNPAMGDDLNNGMRLRSLVIDPGPRTIRGSAEEKVRFDKLTLASFWHASKRKIKTLHDYPKSFPDDSFTHLYSPSGKLDSLGELIADGSGRLLVLGASGKTTAIPDDNGHVTPLSNGPNDLNEAGWFDDIADGPVSAVVIFEDGSTCAAKDGWVVTTPPDFSPQSASVVTLWDDVFDTWVRHLHLDPELFDHRFQESFAPRFADHLAPLFKAVSLQRWGTNLPQRAIAAHDAVGRIQPSETAGETILTGLAFIRNPNDAAQSAVGPPLMPLLMGNPGQNFMSVTLTQYFILSQWNNGHFRADGADEMGPGERLDRAALFNCTGGGLGPGIDLTFVIKDPELYNADWRETGAGPFRIRGKVLDYTQAESGNPFLSVGFVPLHPGPNGLQPAALEPGDLTKFMALPWHADFNACATHNADPNTTTLYWAWPARRPMQVYRAEDVHDGKLGPQRYSIRGEGAYSEDLGTAGRFQNVEDFLTRWHRIGVVLQGSVIDGAVTYSPHQHLETESQLDEPEIKPWPMNSKHKGE